jgi:hypothetical protein
MTSFIGQQWFREKAQLSLWCIYLVISFFLKHADGELCKKQENLGEQACSAKKTGKFDRSR